MNWMTNAPPSLRATPLPRYDSIFSDEASPRMPRLRPLPDIAASVGVTRFSRPTRTAMPQMSATSSAFVGALTRYSSAIQKLQLKLLSGLMHRS
jgi:hypothetical protein